MLHSTICCWGALVVCALSYPVSSFPKGVWPPQELTVWITSTAELKVLADNRFPSGLFTPMEKAVVMGQRAMPTMLARAMSAYPSSVLVASLLCLPRHRKEAFDSGLCAVY